MRRSVIVNADDFGMSAGITNGVIHCFEHGVVTSASLMVRGAAAREAAEYARSRPELSVGLHIGLGEWICRGGTWLPRYQVVPLDDAKAIERAVAEQVRQFRQLVGSSPTHLDSHQHVHMKEPVRSAVLDAGKKLGVCVRNLANNVTYCGAFYGQSDDGQPLEGSLTVQSLGRILKDLPPGISELGCHPGYMGDIDSDYNAERECELHVLCDPQSRLFLSEFDIELLSFHAVQRDANRRNAE